MIAIVGGGYAGAATAWALARLGLGRLVTLLEGEPAAASHASGRNAGLVVSLLDPDPAITLMTVRGARLLRDWFGLRACGSVLLSAERADLVRLAETARRHGVALEVAPVSDLARELPQLAGAASAWAARCASDGTIDPRALALAYLGAARDAGARLITGARVTAISRRSGRVTGVQTTAGAFEADWVVNAAGAWAGQIGVLAGLSDMGLAPFRRHLFVSGPLDGIDPGGPLVWDLTHQVYYRVDEGRLTLSPCDEDPHPPGPPQVCGDAGAELHRKLSAALPALAGLAIEEARACLRTFASDRRYVIGPDPRLPGFFWCAGLGGSGATAGAAVGDLAAALLCGSGPPRELEDAAPAFDPGRLIRDGAGG